MNVNGSGPVANTVADVLRRVGISLTKFYQEINAGRLKARKIGSKTVVLEADLQAYLDALPLYDGRAE
jgi:predicted DNA-binding transcriptional regulator AlpA